jgi:hypothetical protein
MGIKNRGFRALAQALRTFRRRISQLFEPRNVRAWDMHRMDIPRLAQFPYDYK